MFSPKSPFRSQRLPLCNIQLLVSPENRNSSAISVPSRLTRTFFHDRRQHTRMCVTLWVLSPMGYLAEGLKDTPATGKTATSYCCLGIHLIKKGKESKSCYRQIPNESQNETQNTQKKREDGSENFKANPGKSWLLQSLALWCLNEICPFCHYCIINNICLQFQNIFPWIHKRRIYSRHWH